MSIIKFSRSLLFTGFAIVSTVAALPAHSAEFAFVDRSCGQSFDCDSVAKQELILICDGDGTAEHCQVVELGSKLWMNSLPNVPSVIGITERCDAKDRC